MRCSAGARATLRPMNGQQRLQQTPWQNTTRAPSMGSQMQQRRLQTLKFRLGVRGGKPHVDRDAGAARAMGRGGERIRSSAWIFEGVGTNATPARVHRRCAAARSVRGRPRYETRTASNCPHPSSRPGTRTCIDVYCPCWTEFEAVRRAWTSSANHPHPACFFALGTTGPAALDNWKLELQRRKIASAA